MKPSVPFFAFLAMCLSTAAFLPSEFQESSVQAQPTAANRTGYLSDGSCLPCHKQEAMSYKQTSHRLTSQSPSKASILGSFEPGKNILMIENPAGTGDDPRLFFQMDQKDGSYYQTAIAERAGKRLDHQARIDLVIGSGTRGQTYLTWRGNELFELPVSYWKDGSQWINSPGYKDGTANFERHVDPRCLECHSTFIQPLSTDPQTNIYNKDSLIAGISCEVCHGPGASHAAAEQSHPPKNAPMLNPAKLSRDLQIDQCALCHNGTDRAESAPAFSYTPGQPLDKYLGANPADIANHPDVHGNQVGLLKKSRCYLSASAMSCSTCHNVHAPELPAAAYSVRCLTCHQWQACGVSHILGVEIKQNCIDCHMPLQQTNAIVSVTAGNVIHTSIRTHWIKVYPDARIGPH